MLGQASSPTIVLMAQPLSMLYFWFGGHIRRCSGVTPGGASGTRGDMGIEPGPAEYKTCSAHCTMALAPISVFKLKTLAVEPKWEQKSQGGHPGMRRGPQYSLLRGSRLLSQERGAAPKLQTGQSPRTPKYLPTHLCTPPLSTQSPLPGPPYP